MIVRPTLAARAPAFASAYRAAGVRLVLFPISAIGSLSSAYLIMHFAGSETYVLSALIISVVGMLPFLDLGLGATMTRATADLVSERLDQDAFMDTMVSSLRLLVITAAIVSFISIGLGTRSAWGVLAGNGVSNAPDVNIGLTLAAVMFGLAVPFGLGPRLLIGSGHAPTWNALQSLTPAIAALIVVAMLILHLETYTAVASVAALLAIAVLSFTVGLRRVGFKLRTLGRALLEGRRAPRGSLRGSAGPMLVIMIANPIALQSDRLVVSHSSSAGGLGSLSLTGQLFTPVLLIVSAAGAALWPIFQNLRATEAAVAPWKASWAMLGAGSVAAVCVALVGPSVAQFLSDGAIVPSSMYWWSYVALVMVYAFQWPIGMYLTRDSELRFQAACIVGMVTMNVALSICLANYAAWGPVVASAVAVLVCQVIPGIAFVGRRRG